jgi:hypothetical protein
VENKEERGMGGKNKLFEEKGTRRVRRGKKKEKGRGEDEKK